MEGQRWVGITGVWEEELRAGGIHPEGGSASLEVAREVVCPNGHTKVWSGREIWIWNEAGC